MRYGWLSPLVAAIWLASAGIGAAQDRLVEIGFTPTERAQIASSRMRKGSLDTSWTCLLPALESGSGAASDYALWQPGDLAG